MIKFENYEVVGWDHALRGMRNPMNSWERSDSHYCAGYYSECADCSGLDESGCCALYRTQIGITCPIIGPNDHELAMKLAKGGPVHAKYRRMIAVYVDITAPLYWFKEFDTYKVGTVANSCSTMHKIHEKEFTLEDFSCEHLNDSVPEEGFKDCEVPNGVTVWAEDDTGCLGITCRGYFHEDHSYQDTLLLSQKEILDMFVIPVLNANRKAYLKTKDKKYWWQMIQLLPTSYNQKRTIMLSYEVLANMYKWRKDHKLDEWREFCKWIETLPYSELITGEREVKQDENS